MSSYYPARFLTRYIHTTINNRGRPRSQRRDPMLQSSRRKLVFAVLFHIPSHMATQVQVNTHTPVERSLMYGLHIDRVRDRAWPGLACTPSPEPREWVVPLPAAGTKNMLTRTVDGRIETSNSDLMFPSSTLPFLFFPSSFNPFPFDTLSTGSPSAALTRWRRSSRQPTTVLRCSRTSMERASSGLN